MAGRKTGAGLHKSEKDIAAKEDENTEPILEEDLKQSERKKSNGAGRKSGTERKRKSKKIKDKKRKMAEDSKPKTDKKNKKGYRKSKKNNKIKGKKTIMQKDKNKGGKKLRAKKNKDKKNLKKSKLKKRVSKVGRLAKKTASSKQTCEVSCLSTAVKYMKILKDRVLNYKTQKKRIEKFVKVGQSKGNKSEIFKTLLTMLRDAGKL